MKSLWTIYGPGQGRYNVFLKRLRTRSYLDFYGSTTFPAFYATLCHGSTRSQTTIYDPFGDIHHFKTRGAVFVLKWHACRAPVNVISLEYPRYHSLWYITIPTALNLNPLSPLCSLAFGPPTSYFAVKTSSTGTAWANYIPFRNFPSSRTGL